VFFSRDWWYFQDYQNTFFAASYPELTLISKLSPVILFSFLQASVNK